MKNKLLMAGIVGAVLMLASCLSFDYPSRPTKGDTYSQLYAEDPMVLLIMPPINNSANVDAKDYFYSTMTVPVAEAGYYVLPPFMTLEILQRESAYDSELFLEKDLSQFHDYFGADVAVFTVIKAWDKSALDSTLTIKIDYIFKSTKTNEVLYQKTGIIQKDVSVVEGNSFLADLTNVLITSLTSNVTEFIDMAVRCNNRTLSDLPNGKYGSKHQVDSNEYPTSSTITTSLSNQ